MLNYRLGKDLTVLGFLGWSLLLFLGLVDLGHEGDLIVTVWRIALLIVPLGVAGAFCLKFLFNRNIMDLLIAIAIVLSVVNGYIWFGFIIYVLLDRCFMLVLAIKVLRSNRLVAIMLVGAFVCVVLSFFCEFFWNIVSYSIFIVVDALCIGACAVGAFLDNE